MTMLLCLIAVGVSFAENPNMGTWKLNEGKSKLAAGMMKNTLVVYAADGESVKVTTDGTTGDDKPLHTEWTGKFDGKDYPLTGDPSADTRAYTKIDDHTLTLSNKKDGKIVTSGRVVVSADGKTRTLTITGKTAAGKKATSVAVYDKQ
jgi:nicotinate-nucleotide pyrophosphorylase